MEEPPETIDGARVLQFASLKRSEPTGNTRHIRDGVEVGRFAALAVARYDAEPHSVYLFYCDEGWNVVTDTWHEDVDAAIAQANFEFGLLSFAQA